MANQSDAFAQFSTRLDEPWVGFCFSHPLISQQRAQSLQLIGLEGIRHSSLELVSRHLVASNAFPLQAVFDLAPAAVSNAG